MSSFPLLSLLILIPLAGALVTVLMPSHRPQFAKTVALLFSLVSLLLGCSIWQQFDPGTGALQFVERISWIPALNVEYFLGLDGLSLLLVLLTVIIVPFALAVPILSTEKLNVYFSLVLLLEAMVLGVFLSLNFILWFLFWEISLIPAFFLIKLWGGPKRTYAAYQFFLYTLTGSIAMLLGFLAIFLATGLFDFIALAELARHGGLASALGERFAWGISPDVMALWVFVAVFLGLAVKVPIIPFHTWLPEAYTQAPSSVTMILTGLLSKMGVYGLLRILLPIFPIQMQVLQTPLLVLAVATIVFSALAALAQTDLKRIFAYSSINHLGYCLLGIFALVTVSAPTESLKIAREAALSGVYLQIFNHGITAATLFAFVGFLEIRSKGLHGLYDFGGIRKVAPVFCGLMGIALFASLGLPGLNGFVGEFLIFKGAFPLASWATALSLPALLLTAIFFLRILAKVFSGPLSPQWTKFPDLTFDERIILIPAFALIFLLGIFPASILNFLNHTVVLTLKHLP